jgi:DNA-binding YbaB/EbfC family protein
MAKKIKAKGTSRNKMPSGGGAGGNQAAMMAQFQKMQQDMMQAQQELENETVDITVGGGAITVTITGHQRIEAIAINRDSIDLDDDEWLEDLQDLLVAAFNQAVEQSQSMSAERMEGITGGLDGMLPGGLGGLLG